MEWKDAWAAVLGNIENPEAVDEALAIVTERINREDVDVSAIEAERDDWKGKYEEIRDKYISRFKGEGVTTEVIENTEPEIPEIKDLDIWGGTE